MPIVTAIKPQKNKKRVNIYLDDKYAFGLDMASFVKFGIKVEQELSEERIKLILEKAEYQKIYDKLLRFATLRPRSVYEVETWFKKHKVNERLHEKMFNGLKRLDLLDDKKFVEWWIEQRNAFKPRGKKMLFVELKSKGVSKEIINSALSKFELNEKKMALNLLYKKIFRWERLSKIDARKKMSDYLARKGFKWEVIKEVVDIVLEKT